MPNCAVAKSVTKEVVNRLPEMETVCAVPLATVNEVNVRATVWPELVRPAISTTTEMVRLPETVNKPVGLLKVMVLLPPTEAASVKRVPPSNR